MMKAADHPLRRGEVVAQAIYGCDDPAKISRELFAFFDYAYAYNKDRHYSSKQAHRRALKAMHRAAVAPLYHGIEIKRDQQIKQRLAEGRSLLPPHGMPMDRFDRVFNQYPYPPYPARTRSFLRASGWLAVGAATDFWRELMCNDGHWGKAIVDAYRPLHLTYFGLGAPFKLSQELSRYFWDMTIAAAITTSRLLEAAGPHVHLWARPGEDRKAVLLRKAEELAWPQSIHENFFDARFPAPGQQPPGKCPIAHTGGTLWRANSLVRGPWPLQHYCHANIAFSSPTEAGYASPVSAATMRVLGDVLVASQVLFAGEAADPAFQLAYCARTS